MIKKISVSHVDWDKVYELDIEKGMKKIAKGTIKYGLPALAVGGAVLCMHNMVQPQAVIAYASLDEPIHIATDMNMGHEVIGWVQRYCQHLGKTCTFNALSAKYAIEVFKNMK